MPLDLEVIKTLSIFLVILMIILLSLVKSGFFYVDLESDDSKEEKTD